MNEDAGDEGGVVNVVCVPDNVGLLGAEPNGATDGLPTPGAINCICVENESYLSIAQIFESALGRFSSPVHGTFYDFMV